MPSAIRCGWAFWYAITAAFVFSPIQPSMAPGLRPAAVSSSCASFTTGSGWANGSAVASYVALATPV